MKFYTSRQYCYYFYVLFIPLNTAFYFFMYSFILFFYEHNELSRYHKLCCSQAFWENHLEFLNNKKWNQSLFVQVPSVLWMQCDLGICLSKECTKILQKRPWGMTNFILLLHFPLTINPIPLSSVGLISGF